MEKNRHRRIKLIFIFASVLVLSLSIFSYMRINNLMKTASLVNHTNVVKLQLESLFSEIKDAESSQRGYRLSQDPVFIKQFNSALIGVEKRLVMLEKFTSDNYSQRKNTLDLRNLIDKRVAFMKSVLHEPRSIKSVDPKRYTEGLRLMNNVRSQVDKMLDEEDFLLRLRTKSLTEESAITPLFTVFLIICSILVLLISYYGINFELKISNALKRDLEASKQDLQEVNESLQKSNQEIALSRYNKLFLSEFSEKFSNYEVQNEFFNSLVQYIADLTHMDYVFVGKLNRDNEIPVVETLAVSALGKLVDNFIYPLPDGPCEQIIMGGENIYPKDCQLLFPENTTIKQLNVSGYVGYPLFDSDGSAIGIIAAMHQSTIEDTEMLSAILKIIAKRAEMEMLRIKNEQLLASKNHSLEETNAMLAKMNKELESFTYISSHDLQEPLRKIQTFITRIMETETEKLSDNGKNYLNRTQDAANRMQNLIRDLLAYSRLNAEIFPTEQANLYDIISEIKSDLEETIHEKQAVINVKGNADVKIISSQFRQLMTNLMTNSIKFARPETPPQITIENELVKGSKVPFENKVASQSYAKITVSDNGIGFDNEYKDRIFEVFQRLHTIKDYPGTGIGLAIVKKIIDNHHGFISAESKPGSGAVFTIYLPA
jgi:signal transduction histidine kinase/CHASE3 domain sensor protein